MKNLVIGIPCYNEAENISTLLYKWIEQEEKLNNLDINLVLVPLDDKSTDSTASILKELSKKHDNINPLYHSENKNLGGGLSTLINYFLETYSSKDMLVIMDGDNTQEPIYIFHMLDELNKNKDIVIASRYRKGSKVKGVPWYRILASYLARLYYTLVLNINNVRDYTCGYRIYTYDILKKGDNSFKDELITQKSFACMMELLYKLSVSGAKIGEVPFILRYDFKKGESKIKILKTSKDSISTAIKIKHAANKHK